MALPFILKGDKTDHGGEVLEGCGRYTIMGKPAALVGHKVSCPKCHGDFEIAEGAPDYFVDGKAVARQGDKTTCGAKLMGSQSIWTWDGGGQAKAAAPTQGTKHAANSSSSTVKQDHPKDAPTAAMSPAGDTKPKPVPNDEQIRFITVTGKPIPNAKYILTLDDGTLVTGQTDAEGRTARVTTDKSQAITEAELIPATVFCCAVHAQVASQSEANATIKITLKGVKTHPDAFGTSVVQQKVEQKTRGLTVGEIEMARKMFGDALDYAKVKIHSGGLMGVPNHTDNAMTPKGEIHFPANSALPDFAVASDADKVWFIHEMTHVWQYQMGYGVAWHGIVIGAKGGYGKGAPAYQYDPASDAKKRLQDFNMEQQGELISHYFDAVFLDDHDPAHAVYHRKRFANLTFYTRVLTEFIKNPNNAALVPNTTHIE